MYITKERYEELIEQAVGCQLFMDVMDNIELADIEKIQELKIIYEIKKNRGKGEKTNDNIRCY